MLSEEFRAAIEDIKFIPPELHTKIPGEMVRLAWPIPFSEEFKPATKDWDCGGWLMYKDDTGVVFGKNNICYFNEAEVKNSPEYANMYLK